MTRWEQHRQEADALSEQAMDVCNERFFKEHVLAPLIPTDSHPMGNHEVSERAALDICKFHNSMQELIATWPSALQDRYTADHHERHNGLRALENRYERLHRDILYRNATGAMLHKIVDMAARAQALTEEMREKIDDLRIWD